MTRLLAVLAGGVLALSAAGALARFLPAHWLPDLGLLVAVALGLYRPGASGLLLSWVLGLAEGLLYGAPLGLHALLRMVAWSATRLADRSIHVHQLGLLVIFVSVLTLVDALLLFALSRSFGITGWPAPGLLAALLPRLVLNAATAAVVGRCVEWALGERAERGTARGTLRLESRPPGL